MLHMSEADVSELLSVEQAIAILDSVLLHPREIELPLPEAYGLRLAQEVLADRDYPPFDKSLMDGFAVCDARVEAGTMLKLAGEVAAGQSPARPLAVREAIQIMTGAPMPSGAAGVVPVENAQIDGQTVRITRATDALRHTAKAGSDLPAGRVVLSPGMRLDAAQLSVAATVGLSIARVYAAPRVAICATGDEIIPFDAQPGPAQIRNSNNIMLTAQLRRLPCRVVDMGLVPDDPEQIRRAILRGMQLDALLVTGGMSMGKYDYVPKLLEELGVELKITKLRIKPGKPFVFGVADRKVIRQRLEARQTAQGGSFIEPAILGPAEGNCYIFGLPGNPVSSFACTHRLVLRLLMRLSGGAPEEKWRTGQIQSPLPPNGSREFYQPIRAEFTTAGLKVHPLDYKGSADLFTLAQANALLVRPADQPALAPGDIVRVMEL
jgi:molybdopterin molybdotransferase